MTNPQIESRIKELCKDCREYNTLTSEQKYEYNELVFRRYINSCIIYKQEYLVVKNGFVSMNKDTKNLYCRGEYFNIGDERILEIFNEQKETFKKANINVGVHTDSEGVSYNSVNWG